MEKRTLLVHGMYPPFLVFFSSVARFNCCSGPPYSVAPPLTELLGSGGGGGSPYFAAPSVTELMGVGGEVPLRRGTPSD